MIVEFLLKRIDKIVDFLHLIRVIFCKNMYFFEKNKNSLKRNQNVLFSQTGASFKNLCLCIDRSLQTSPLGEWKRRWFSRYFLVCKYFILINILFE
ncbi:MAG: hypothetical protein EAZ44_05750 [Cytophagia bacterium]|nr:MAG: hypothetical protein EAZ44_05750 [Cytophagia bacterium]TAG42970.1 MAG: hypothetical protein EAZ31_05215 [Cytophagia bacterium]